MKNWFIVIGCCYALWYLYHIIKDMYFVEGAIAKNKDAVRYSFEEDERTKKINAEVFKEELQQEEIQESYSYAPSQEETQKAEEEEEQRELGESLREADLKEEALEKNIKKRETITESLTHKNKNANDVEIKSESLAGKARTDISNLIENYNQIDASKEVEAFSKFTINLT